MQRSKVRRFGMGSNGDISQVSMFFVYFDYIFSSMQTIRSRGMEMGHQEMDTG